jgi:hypothetical protein
MDTRMLVTVLVVALVVVYLVATTPGDRPPPRKRRRTPAAADSVPVSAPSSLLPVLLKCVKWETISNMLHWKSEMSQLDNLLEQLAPPQAPSTEHSC